MRSATAVGVALGLVWGLIQALTHHLAPLPALLDIGAYGVTGAGAVYWAVLLKLWGLDAIRDKPVAHKHGRKTVNTVDELWLPADVVEHNQQDWALRKGEPAPLPCVACGNPEGSRRWQGPRRYNGARFGLEGRICQTCYNRLLRRQKRGLP